MRFVLLSLKEPITLGAEVSCLSTRALKKVKVKFTLEQATKAQRGSRGIALLFL